MIERPSTRFWIALCTVTFIVVQYYMISALLKNDLADNDRLIITLIEFIISWALTGWFIFDGIPFINKYLDRDYDEETKI